MTENTGNEDARAKPQIRGKALDPPPIAFTESQSVEFLRIWADPRGGQQFSLSPVWKDPGAWGLLLVDLARHAAEMYGREGRDRDATLRRIREMFDAEWVTPTDDVDLSGGLN